MAEPTLVQVFGTSAVQDGSTLTISKADLASVGLTASANNRAEQLFVALILKAMAYLNPTLQDTDNDVQVTIESSFPSFVYKNNQNYRQSSYTISLQKLDTATTVDPDDY